MRQVDIYLSDKVAPYDVLSRRLFKMIENGEVASISVGEVMQGPLRRGFDQAAVEVKDYYTKFRPTPGITFFRLIWD